MILKKIVICFLCIFLFSCNTNSLMMNKLGLKKGQPLYCIGVCHVFSISSKQEIIVSEDDGTYVVSGLKDSYLFLQKKNQEITSEEDYSIDNADISINTIRLALSPTINTIDEGKWVANKKLADDINQKRKRELQKIENERIVAENAKRTYLARISKKSGGKPWCKYRTFGELIYENGTLPRNCVFKMVPALLVLQQTPDGTLADLLGEGRIVYFITKNKIDSNLVDREIIPNGVFINIGQYTYVSALGNRKTVHKLKRIE